MVRAEPIGLKLWVDYACWLFCDVFSRWREAVLLRKFVRRMQRVVADMTVRGTTRQWLAGVEAAAGAVNVVAGRVAKAAEVSEKSSGNGEGDGRDKTRCQVIQNL